MSKVRRFLVTGTDDALADFHVRVAMTWNVITRREQTIFYTAFADTVDPALEAARTWGLTIQELHVNKGETTELLIQGDLPAWKPSKNVG